MSADKTAKVWEISEDNTGKVKKTLTSSGCGGVDDMLVGGLWLNDNIVTVSLGGTINLYSASDLDKEPLSLYGHMKHVTALDVFKSDPKMIVSGSYDGVIVRWTQGVGYTGKVVTKEGAKIKHLAVIEDAIITSGYDNKVITV